MDITQLILSSLIVGLSGAILYRQRNINRRLDRHGEHFEELRADLTRQRIRNSDTREDLVARIYDIEQQLGSQLDVVGQLVERGVALLDDADARLAEIDRFAAEEQERRRAALKKLTQIGEELQVPQHVPATTFEITCATDTDKPLAKGKP